MPPRNVSFAAIYNPSALSWLPTNAVPIYPERRRLGDAVEPFTETLYKPEGLQWKPSEAPLARPLPRPTQGWNLLDPFPLPPVVAFDPAHLAWMPRGQQPVRDLPRASAPPRTVGVAQLYDPAALSWLGPPAPIPELPELRQPSSVLSPFPIPGTPYDPAGLQWIPGGRAPVRELPRVWVDRTEVAAGLYDPAGLDWFIQAARPNPPLPAARQSWTVFSPFPVAPVTYDPATLSWMPAGSPFGPRELPRARSDWTESVAGLYDPAGLDWFVQVGRPNFSAPRSIPTWVILDPLPIPPPPFDPAHLAWIASGRVPIRILERAYPGIVVLDPLSIVDVTPPVTPPGGIGGGGGGKKRRPRHAPVARAPRLAIEPFLKLAPDEVAPPPILEAPAPAAPSAPAIPPDDPANVAPIVLPRVPVRVSGQTPRAGDIDSAIIAFLKTLEGFTPRPRDLVALEPPVNTDDQDLEDLLMLRAFLHTRETP